MQSLAGIVRSEEEMQEGLETVLALAKRTQHTAATGNREYNPGWHTALDLPNLMVVSEAVIRAGLSRKESRGAHFREDYPEKSESYNNLNTVIRKGPDGEMQVSEEEIPEMPDELKQIIQEMQ